MINYPTLARRGSRIPFGYNANEDNPSELIPDVAALDKLQETIAYLEGGALSYRDAAAFLAYETNRPITHEGLRLIYKERKHPIYEV